MKLTKLILAAAFPLVLFFFVSCDIPEMKKIYYKDSVASIEKKLIQLNNCESIKISTSAIKITKDKFKHSLKLYLNFKSNIDLNDTNLNQRGINSMGLLLNNISNSNDFDFFEVIFIFETNEKKIKSSYERSFKYFEKDFVN